MIALDLIRGSEVFLPHHDAQRRQEDSSHKAAIPQPQRKCEVIRIEVTSLNPPDEEVRVQALVNRVINLGFMKEVATGGYVSRVPSLKILEDVLKQVDQAIDEIKHSRKVKKFNYEGVATIYPAPQDMVNQMPEDSDTLFTLFNLPASL